MSFRYGTSVPYRRVSTDTIFNVQSMTLVHSAGSSQAHFFSNGAPNDSDNNGPEQCGPNVPMRFADNSQNSPIRYNTQDITTGSNKMLCPRKAAESILATNCTYSNEFTTRSSDKGVFHRSLTRMIGFYYTFPIFVSVKP